MMFSKLVSFFMKHFANNFHISLVQNWVETCHRIVKTKIGLGRKYFDVLIKLKSLVILLKLFSYQIDAIMELEQFKNRKIKD